MDSNSLNLVLLEIIASTVKVRACLHGGWGPQVGEVTHLGGVSRLSIYISHFNLIPFK